MKISFHILLDLNTNNAQDFNLHDKEVIKNSFRQIKDFKPHLRLEVLGNEFIIFIQPETGQLLLNSTLNSLDTKLGDVQVTFFKGLYSIY